MFENDEEIDERTLIQQKHEQVTRARQLLGLVPETPEVPPLTPEEILGLRALLAAQATPWNGEPLTSRMPPGWRGIPEMTDAFRVAGAEKFTAE